MVNSSNKNNKQTKHNMNYNSNYNKCNNKRKHKLQCSLQQQKRRKQQQQKQAVANIRAEITINKHTHHHWYLQHPTKHQNMNQSKIFRISYENYNTIVEKIKEDLKLRNHFSKYWIYIYNLLLKFKQKNLIIQFMKPSRERVT